MSKTFWARAQMRLIVQAWGRFPLVLADRTAFSAEIQSLVACMDIRLAIFDRIVDECLIAKGKSVRVDRRASVSTTASNEAVSARPGK